MNNVVVLIVDSLRSDSTVCSNGPTGIHTPAMEQLADEGIIFENAFSTAPESAASHASIFTGQYPSNNGVISDASDYKLPPETPTMATWFSKKGYDTLGIAGPGKMGKEYGFDKGFDKYIESYDIPSRKNVEYYSKEKINTGLIKDMVEFISNGPDDYTRLKFRRLRQFLTEKTKSPKFALANFTICHSPYDPPRPWKNRLTPSFSRPRFYISEIIQNLIGKKYNKFKHKKIRDDRIFNYTDSLARYMGNEDWLNNVEMNVLSAWYHAALQYFDTKLAKFINWIDKSELINETTLIITSDHGEFFGEHKLMGHNDFLYDEVIHVPLLISGPSIAEGQRRDDLVSLVDLFPSLCEKNGLETPKNLDGMSVFSNSDREYIVAECGERDISNMGRAKYLPKERIKNFNIGRKIIRNNEHKFEICSDNTERLYKLPDESVVENEKISELLKEELLKNVDQSYRNRTVDSVDIRSSVEQNLNRLGYL